MVDGTGKRAYKQHLLLFHANKDREKVDTLKFYYAYSKFNYSSGCMALVVESLVVITEADT